MGCFRPAKAKFLIPGDSSKQFVWRVTCSYRDRSYRVKLQKGRYQMRTVVTGLILAIICLATYAVTSIQSQW